MDTVPHFVQLIKLVQVEVGMGNARVRPPRLELVDDELEQARKVIRYALQSRQQLVGSSSFSSSLFGSSSPSSSSLPNGK
jgi:hypothetical protein